MRNCNFLRLIYKKVASRSYNYFLKFTYFNFLRKASSSNISLQTSLINYQYFVCKSILEGILNFKFYNKKLMIILANLTICIDLKFKMHNFHLYINSKILFQIILYYDFHQIIEFKSTLKQLGFNMYNSLVILGSNLYQNIHFQTNLFILILDS
jgi:hypothetical protein